LGGSGAKRRSSRKSYWQIFKAQSLQKAQRRLQLFCRRWQREEPAVVQALREREEKLFASLSLPYGWRESEDHQSGREFLQTPQDFLETFSWITR